MFSNGNAAISTVTEYITYLAIEIDKILEHKVYGVNLEAVHIYAPIIFAFIIGMSSLVKEIYILSSVFLISGYLFSYLFLSIYFLHCFVNTWYNFTKKNTLFMFINVFLTSYAALHIFSNIFYLSKLEFSDLLILYFLNSTKSLINFNSLKEEKVIFIICASYFLFELMVIFMRLFDKRCNTLEFIAIFYIIFYLDRMTNAYYDKFIKDEGKSWTFIFLALLLILANFLIFYFIYNVLIVEVKQKSSWLNLPF